MSDEIIEDDGRSGIDAELSTLAARRHRAEARGVVYRGLRWHPQIQPLTDTIERGEAFEEATGETFTTVWKGMDGWLSGVTLADLRFVLAALRQRKAQLIAQEQGLAEQIEAGSPTEPTFDAPEMFDPPEQGEGSDAPTWSQPGSTNPYPLGAIVAHAGTTWISRHPFNVWEPGATGVDARIWESLAPPPAGHQPWAQPAGAHNAYQTGDRVTHNGQTWTSDVDDNVWEPGVFGWAAD